MKMLDFYKSILKAANLEVSKDGCVSIKTESELLPLTLKGKRLVLPTKEHLSSSDRETRIIFHPLSENLMRGESEVFTRYKLSIVAHLNTVFGNIMLELLTLGTSAAEHNKLTPDQTEFLTTVKNADEKTVQSYKKILEKIPVEQMSKFFTSIYIKRGGVVNGIKHRRAGVVTFPFYKELKEAGKDIYGVSLRNRDKESLLALMEYMIPEISDESKYVCVSDSNVAPYLDALLKSVERVAAPLNDISSVFSNIFVSNYEIESEWVDSIENLETMLPEIRNVPMQAGNEGAARVDEKQEVPQATQQVPPVVTRPTAQQPMPAPQQPQYQQQPMQQPVVTETGVVKTNGGIDFAATMQNQQQQRQQQQYQPQYYPQQPQMVPQYQPQYPQQPMQQPQYYPQQQYQQPQVPTQQAWSQFQNAGMMPMQQQQQYQQPMQAALQGRASASNPAGPMQNNWNNPWGQQNQQGYRF